MKTFLYAIMPLSAIAFLTIVEQSTTDQLAHYEKPAALVAQELDTTAILTSHVWVHQKRNGKAAQSQRECSFEKNGNFVLMNYGIPYPGNWKRVNRFVYTELVDDPGEIVHELLMVHSDSLRVYTAAFGTTDLFVKK